MSCELRSRVSMLETEVIAAADAARLEAHAAECAECAETLLLVRGAREAARRHRVVARPAARAVVWRGVERETSRSVWSSIAPIFAAAAAACVIALIVWPREPAEVAPVPVARAVPAPAPAEVGPRVAIGGGAKFRVIEETIELTSLELESGELIVRALEGVTVEIVTTDARVKLIGAGTFVKDARGTRVHVDRGTASAWPKRAAVPVEIRAGETKEVTAAKSVEPVAAAEPQRVPLRSPQRAALPRVEVATPAREEPETSEPGSSARDTSDFAALREARAALRSDAPRAAALAESVLERAPKSAVEAEALAVLADAERRRGRLDAAADLYGRVADHSDGGPFAEEALLQRAIILARTSRANDALSELTRAESRFPDGATALERASLAAAIHLELGAPDRAADAIERASSAGGRSLELSRRRVDVARALRATDAARARALLAPVLSSDNPPELRALAREVADQIK